MDNMRTRVSALPLGLAPARSSRTPDTADQTSVVRATSRLIATAEDHASVVVLSPLNASRAHVTT